MELSKLSPEFPGTWLYIMRLLAFFTLSIICTSCAAMPAPGTTSHGVILQYHHDSSNTPAITSISPDRFAAQMSWLASHDFQIWPLEKLVNYVKQDKPTPRHVAAITFDDAYESIYTTAYPILKQRGWPFTIFVATRFVGTSPGFYLSWKQLKEMQATGTTIGNHTYDHTHLIRHRPGESDKQWHQRIVDDIQRAEDMIHEHLGVRPNIFVYPYGEYDPAVIAIIKQLHYIGFGQQSGAIGPNSLFSVLPRYPMGGKYSRMASFESKMETLPLPIKPVATDPIIGNQLRPILTLHFLSRNLRFGQLVCYGPDGTTPTVLKQTSADTFEAQSKVPVPIGRSRYNCTMPVENSSRFYWFSQMWIRKEVDGSWYPEP